MGEDHIYCRACGKWRRVPQWPLRCICGREYRSVDDVGRLMHIAAHPLKIGDWIAMALRQLRIRGKPGCRCPERQAALNRAGGRVYHVIWAVVTWFMRGIRGP
jgi:hypothetical protein